MTAHIEYMVTHVTDT